MIQSGEILKRAPTPAGVAKMKRSAKRRDTVKEDAQAQKERETIQSILDEEDANKKELISAIEALNDLVGQESETKFSIAPRTDSKEFKKWFGDSKVVNEDGSPMVVYHGTGAQFTEFKKERATDKEGRKMAMGWGKDKFYFTPHDLAAKSSSEYAVMTGRGKTPQVMPVYLKLEKPADSSL